GSVHLIVDGWRAPFAYSYLGVIVCWYADGKIWQMTLEFLWSVAIHPSNHSHLWYCICKSL
ncbi:hypothetical protein PISMIDRAFT_106740, partial [Pisolithus microcarpus 441]